MTIQIVLVLNPITLYNLFADDLATIRILIQIRFFQLLHTINDPEHFDKFKNVYKISSIVLIPIPNLFEKFTPYIQKTKKKNPKQYFSAKFIVDVSLIKRFPSEKQTRTRKHCE